MNEVLKTLFLKVNKKTFLKAKNYFSNDFNWYTIYHIALEEKRTEMKKTTTIVSLALTMFAAYAILKLISLKLNLNDAVSQIGELREEIRQGQSDFSEQTGRIYPIATGKGIEGVDRHRNGFFATDEKIFKI
jgi:hypothetical protein